MTDYERGYNNGYRAGLRKGGQVAPSYRKQYWRCVVCGATGLILVSSSDDAEKRAWRFEQSHAVRQPNRNACHEPDIFPLAPRQGRRLVDPWRLAKGSAIAVAQDQP